MTELIHFGGLMAIGMLLYYIGRWHGREDGLTHHVTVDNREYYGQQPPEPEFDPADWWKRSDN